ncbi:MAG: gliding motility-associated C-terminal domain-containing protein [Prevotella sp.]|nr:gliding motility-associated C-terminal domain-containing protein [Prevotella sp.]
MKRSYLLCCALALCLTTATAQDDYPTINPTATYTDIDGKEEQSNDYSGSAPLIGRFEANPENVGSWNAYYEWRFTLLKEQESEPYLIRYEQDTEYTFTEAGTHHIVLYAIFTQGKDSILYTQDYWNDVPALSVTISESKLDMPNAFSPNGDDINDIYGAKEGYKSLVEFHATIYNRWGQKIYEWDDPAGGWDGTFNGKEAKQGTYFVLVKAKGADGRVYNIRRDVNLLRGYRENESSSTSTNP